MRDVRDVREVAANDSLRVMTCMQLCVSTSK